MAVSADRADSPEHSVPSPPAPPRRPGRWRAVLVALALVVLLAALSWYLVQRSRAPAGPGAPGGAPGSGVPGVGMVFGGAMPASTVGAARARQGELPIIIDALGTVTPPITAALVPQVSGVLTEVLFEEGQRVKKGQVLARIDPRPFEQALAQAKSQSARDQAQLSAARVTLARYEELWRQDSIARQTLDTQSALVQQLEAALQADRAAEGTARLNLEHSTLRAPVAGTIGLRAVDPGNLVSSGMSGGIATITQVQPIDVLFAVPQDRVPAVLAAHKAATGTGLPVQALDRARTQTLAEGRFLTLDNQVTASTGTVRAKARFANEDGALFPNQFVNARLQLGVERGVLVPVTALRSGPQGEYVYVIDDERTAHLRPVVRGMASVREVLITQGLAAGERVVTEGGDRVKDGGKVQLAGEGGAPGGRGGAAGPGQPGVGRSGGGRSGGGHAPAPAASAPAAPAPAASGAPAPASASH